MLQTLFIAGSIAISRLAPEVVKRIAAAVENGLAVVVGDAAGADTAIQRVLLDVGAVAVRIFCSGDVPRNNVGDWPVKSIYPESAPGTRAWFTAKDVAMASVADYGLMIWDARSTGTLMNVLELLLRRRTTVVFVNKAKIFVTVSDVDGLERLVTMMSPTARTKAEDKIRLGRRITQLRNEQIAMPL